MSEYVSCPACHGRGLVPLEDAERVTVHRQADHEAAQAERRAQLAEAARVTLARRQADAEGRMQAIERLLS